MDALGYVRVSKVGRREGDSFISPGEQRKAIEAVCKRQGLNLIEVLEEFDASGGDNSRPKWNEALERIESGEINALVVWNLSRFSRSTIDGLKAIERVEAAGGSLYSAAGDVGDNTPSGKLTRTIFLGLGQMERERSRDSFASAQANAILRGIHTASHMPTGYTRKIIGSQVVNGKERHKYEGGLIPDGFAPLIKDLYEKRAAGAPLGELVRWFVASGGSVKTNRSTIAAMLKNRAYIGEARNGDQVNPKAHEPIVSVRLFDAVQKMRGQGRPHTGKAAAASLLGGFLVCDGCGRRMSTTQNGSGKYVYRCNYQVCPSRATCMVYELDDEVVERLLTYWQTYQFVDFERTVSNEDELEADLVEARGALADAQYLLDTWKAGRREAIKNGMTVAEYTADLVTYQNEVAEVQLALEMAESVQPEPANPERVAELWDTWSHETKKEWLGKNLTTVIVKKSGQGRAKKIHVSERMALGLSDGLWLHRKSECSAEPFGEPQPVFRRFVERSRPKAAVKE